MVLVVHEHAEQQQAGHRAADRGRVPTTAGVDEAVAEQAQSRTDQHGADDVEVLGPVHGLRLRDVAHAQHHDGHGDGNVDPEGPAPGDVLDEPAADDRPEGGADARQSGPHTDRLGPLPGDEDRREDRQAAGGEQRAADSLQGPGRDQRLDVPTQRTQHRRGGEPDDAHQEDPPAPEPVAERPAQQDQPGQRQQVRVEYPLERGEAGVEVLADAVGGDVDDRPVEEGHAGAEDRRGEGAAAGRRAQFERHRPPFFPSEKGRGSSKQTTVIMDSMTDVVTDATTLDGFDLRVQSLGPAEQDSPLLTMLSERKSSYHWVDEERPRRRRRHGAGDVRPRAAGRRPAGVRAGRPATQDLLRRRRPTRAGIVTCGGLCPGLNDVIRGLVMELPTALRGDGDPSASATASPGWSRHGQPLTPDPGGRRPTSTSTAARSWASSRGEQDPGRWSTAWSD